jgi:hypothetical protein
VAIRESIEISRSPEDVFAYIDDLATHGEWQEQVVSAKVDSDSPHQGRHQVRFGCARSAAASRDDLRGH